MRSLVVVLSLVVMLVGATPFEANAGDAETIAAINDSSIALDDAFSKGDVDTIKKLMTPDHIT